MFFTIIIFKISFSWIQYIPDSVTKFVPSKRPPKSNLGDSSLSNHETTTLYFVD